MEINKEDIKKAKEQIIDSVTDGRMGVNSARLLNRLLDKQLLLYGVVGQGEQLFCEDCQKWVNKQCGCGNKELARDETY